MREEKLVIQCQKQKSKAQKKVYDMYAPLLLSVCRRYVVDSNLAEDVLQEGFFKVFTKIDSFTWKGEKSFFFWMKRIMINTSINFLKKNKEKQLEDGIDDVNEMQILDTGENFFDESWERFSKEEVMQAFEGLHPRYGVVLNMYILDGLKHKEIAELLNIAEETSRCRLTRGKQMFRDVLLEKAAKKTVTSAL